MSEGRGLPRALRPGVLEMVPWLPTAAGVAFMLGLLVFAVVSLRPSGTDLASPPVPAPITTPPFLAGPAAPAPSPSPSKSPPPSPSLSPSATGTPAPPRTAAPDLTGRFTVVATFSDSFIGEVRVTNASRSARGWTVRLRFSSSVGELRAFWVENAPRPRLAREGDLLTFASGASVAAGGSARLRFQLDRDGSAVQPTTCTVNGAPCTGLGGGGTAPARFS